MKTNSKRTAYIVIILLLLLTNFIGAYFLLKGKKQSDIQQQEISNIETDYGIALKDIEAYETQLLSMKGQNAKLDSLIEIREKELDKIKKEIESLFYYILW